MKNDMWTHFWDMSSGGSQKLKYKHIFIEAPSAEAQIIFYNRFKRNPNRVTCTCCGRDYSISEEKILEQLTAYQRGCEYVYLDPQGKECLQEEAWERGKGQKKGYTSQYVERPQTKLSFVKYQTLKEFARNKDILILYAKDINLKERKGKIPKEGYVWVE